MFNFIENLKKIKVPILTPLDIAVDMGTKNTRVAIHGKGIVLREATALGLNTKTREYVFFGDEAATIIGKTPEVLKIIKPVVSGVISDFDAQVALIENFIEKSVYPYLTKLPFLKPPLRAIVGVPAISTEIERKAVEEVAAKVGFSTCAIVEKPLATAYSLKINIFSHHPVLLADLGGGLVEMSIISGGGLVSEKTLKTAGETMNGVVANYAYLKYGIVLGEATCEELKIKLLNFLGEEKTLMVRGKSLENGLPKSVRMKSGDIYEALTSSFSAILDGIKELIEVSPPEVVDAIYERGIVVAGGLARISGIDRFFSKELKIDTIIHEDYENATIQGLLKLSGKPDDLRKLTIPQI